MDTELKKGTAKYRLLFFQPNPEDGERVCVGVLLEEEYGRSYSVLYDDKFPKVHCIAPGAEPELIKCYLDDLDDALRSRSGDDPILILRRYGPQLIASEERLVSLPITETTKLRLLERFVGPCGVSDAKLDYAEAETRPKDGFAEHIRLFVGKYIPDNEILRDAGPKQIFGYAMADFGTIAIAVKRPRKTIMIDGVDLQLMNRKQVVSRANTVAYKFWQYGRLRSNDNTLLQQPFSRIGVVLDGSTHRARAYYEAHDFALHQFQKEADIAVDMLTGQGTREFEEVLTSVE
jgi:hypothetical protein